MSDFECINGHLMSSRDKTCPVCGKPVHEMDGMTARQLAQEARRERAREEGYEDEEEYYG